MKRGSKKTRERKTMPTLAAAGLSLTLANEASLAATAPAIDTPSGKPVVSQEIVLREGEIFDVSLATIANLSDFPPRTCCTKRSGEKYYPAAEDIGP